MYIFMVQDMEPFSFSNYKEKVNMVLQLAYLFVLMYYHSVLRASRAVFQ
jgi:hypothetical protein